VPLEGGAAVPFLRREGREEWQRAGPWYLRPEGLARAVAILRRGVEGGWLVVDEVGPLETGGRGVWPALEPRLRSGEGRFLLVVRETVVPEIEARLPGRIQRVFRPGEAGLPGSLAELLAGPGT